VISDTLIEHLPNRDQLLSVVRHEIGHAKMNHVLKNVLLKCLFYTTVFVVIAFCLLRHQSQILKAFGITFESLYLALFIIGNFALSVLLYLFEILGNMI
jgi:Zn-dependent protease with chaperone function